jgi:NADH:ubiquinone oxidoreductase subunit 2 (subunit N)
VTPLLFDIGLAALALLVFFADLALPETRKRFLGWLACAGLLCIFGATFLVDVQEEGFGGVFVTDGIALWFKRTFLVAGALAVLIAIDPVERNFARRQGEY